MAGLFIQQIALNASHRVGSHSRVSQQPWDTIAIKQSILLFNAGPVLFEEFLCRYYAILLMVIFF